MTEPKPLLTIRLGKAQVRGLLVLALILGGSVTADSDTFTATATYPSPIGVYRRITTLEGAVLARDGGSVGIGRVPSGNWKLEVAGTISSDRVLAAGQDVITAITCVGFTCEKNGSTVTIRR